jgi:hypothetical protein
VGTINKWVWDIYDIFGGEIAMTCDNPECGRTSKMCMVPEKNGNATALVADNSQVEATEKVMNSQTEIDISKVLIEGDIATIMGEKYQRIIEPQSFYDKLWELLKTKLDSSDDTDEMGDRVLNLIMENIPKPIVGGIMEYNAGWNECIRKINKNIFK